MTYSLYLQDSWGRARVGSYETLAQAREVFEALCQDRWCVEDGTVRGVALVEHDTTGERVVASHRFQVGG